MIELIDRTAEADISRAHTDFVANASHELRTPLAAIIGYVETLADEPASVDAEAAARFHATVLREAQADAEPGRRPDVAVAARGREARRTRPTRSTSAQLAARVAGEFAGDRSAPSGSSSHRPTRARRGHAATRKQLEQLLRNLVDNALKYGDADEPVTVAVERGDAAWPADR